jgi:hypothetical protein
MSIMIFLPQGLFVGLANGAAALWRRRVPDRAEA